MNPQKEHLVIAQLNGLRPAILHALERGHRLHFKVGESLNALRQIVLDELSEEERSFAAPGMPEMVFDDYPASPWTVEPSEALRLLCQLAEIVGIKDIHLRGTEPKKGDDD